MIAGLAARWGEQKLHSRKATQLKVPDLEHRAVEAIDEILRHDHLPIEFAVEALDAAGPEAIEKVDTGLGGADATEAAVVGVGVALDEAVLDEAIDDAGDGGDANAEGAGDLAVAGAGR